MQYCPDYFQDFDPSGGCWNLITHLIEVCSVNVVFIAFGAYRKSSVERFVVYNYLDFSFLFLNSFNQRKNLNRNCRFIKLFLIFSFLLLKKRLQRSVTKMETGLDIRIVTEHGQITLCVTTAHMKK